LYSIADRATSGVARPSCSANAASRTAPEAVSASPNVTAACGPPTWFRWPSTSVSVVMARVAVISLKSIPAVFTHGTVFFMVSPTVL
jgi:hypothetical protein